MEENEKQKNAAGKRGTEKTAKEKIQWHPGFVAATELEFRKNRDDLVFNPEYSLSKRPLAIDILIKKKRDVAIENEIGRIFRVHNVLEYKSPEASLNIDNYYKTVAYACLYKALGEHVNDIKADEVTVSIFREVCPKGLLAELAGSGAVIERRFPGIYYISGKGTLFDTQIVVTGELSQEGHSSLRILSANVQEGDVIRFLDETKELSAQGDRHNKEAVLEVSAAANPQTIYKYKEENGIMGPALERLMAKEIAERYSSGLNDGLEQGLEKGRVKGMVEICCALNMSDAEIVSTLQKQLNISEQQAETYLDEYRQQA